MHPRLSFAPYNQPYLHLKSSLQTSTLLMLQERSWLHFCKTVFSARKFLFMNMSLWTSVVNLWTFQSCWNIVSLMNVWPYSIAMVLTEKLKLIQNLFLQPLSLQESYTALVDMGMIWRMATQGRLPDTGWNFIQVVGLFSQGDFYYFCSP